MSLPTYLLARCTARRTQSVQKMCSPYTASPKGCTGSDLRITYGDRAGPVMDGIPWATSPVPSPALAAWGLTAPTAGEQGGLTTSLI